MQVLLRHSLGQLRLEAQLTLSKFLTFGKGTGKIKVAQCETLATDPGDITETIAVGDLTHDVLKDKINALLAAMRIGGFFR